MKNYSIGSFKWDSDMETILRDCVQDFAEVFEGTDYYVIRNGTANEKCVNLMKRGEKGRVGHIWPKRTAQGFDVCLKDDLVSIADRKVELPETTEVKKDRLRGWKKFPKISYEKTTEILGAIAGK